MRTVLDINADVLAAATTGALREQTSVGQVVSELLRQGLTPREDIPAALPSVVHEVPALFGFRRFAKRGVIVTNEIVDRLE